MRIGELLSLTIQQVWVKGEPATHITLEAHQTKAGRSRTIPLNDQAKFALAELMAWRHVTGLGMEPSSPLFLSRQSTPLTRQQAHNIIQEAVSKAGLSGKVATHSMRKTLGTEMMKNGVPLPVIAEVLDHKDLQSLARYLGVGQEQIEHAVKGLNWSGGPTNAISPKHSH